MPIDFENG